MELIIARHNEFCLLAEDYVMERYCDYQTLEFWKRFVKHSPLDNVEKPMCGFDACRVDQNLAAILMYALHY